MSASDGSGNGGPGTVPVVILGPYKPSTAGDEFLCSGETPHLNVEMRLTAV
jgi:hypothetical protein